MTFVRKWNFDGAARLLATSDLDTILDPESDLGAAMQLVIDGLSISANLPPGGLTGQTLLKASNASGDVGWETLEISDVNGLAAALAGAGTAIPDGTAGQFYKQLSATPGDQGWASIAQTDVSGLVAALAAKQPQDGDLDAIAALTKVNNNFLGIDGTGAYAMRTGAQVKAQLALVKGDVGLGSVDNTSDATKWAATKTLTNTTIDANSSGNSVTGLTTDDITGLDAALAVIPSVTSWAVKYNTAGAGSWPARSSSGTSDPAQLVTWVGGPAGPSITGTGSTGAVNGDLWVRQA